MREDILKHMSNLVSAIEDLITEYERLNEKDSGYIPDSIEDKILTLQNVVKWSKND
jgi:hypothetical protein